MATRTVSAALAMTPSFMFLPATSSGQSGTTGAIAGTLTDTTGAVLPGVTVEASSPALIERVRVAVSDGSGEYKVVDLRPGTYTVTFTLPGFSVVQRENVVLTTGFTAAVNAEMTVGEVTETVVVTGVSPIVDVQNVRSMNVLSREVLDSVPNSKTVQSFADLTLGASITDSGPVTKDVAGNTGERAAAIVIHGTRGKDSKLNIDGMNYNYLGGSGGGNQRTFRINQIGVQEVALQTSGVGAESETGGVQVNYVPRDGANMFTLYSLANFTNGSMQNRNLSDDLRTRGLTDETSIHKIYDAGVGIGGAIIQDRVVVLQRQSMVGC